MRGRKLFQCGVLVLWSACFFQWTEADQAAPVARRSLHDQARSRLSQISGNVSVRGLRGEVRVVRDRWGVPHIYAHNTADLFFAQGFVQAQDRLFQMDLWRRGTQGYLSEVLGDDFIERDRLSRLLRYRGDMSAEWSSYAPDAKAIITSFVSGINAWIEIARKNPPLEFTLAGYEPALWKPEDVLSRAEAFLMSGNATSEVFRAQLTAAVGPERAAALLPPDPFVPVPVPAGLDLAWIDARLATALSYIGTGASGFGPSLRLRSPTSWLRHPAEEIGSNNWVVSGARSVTGRPLLANDPHRALDHPSLRYIVHLNAPGWNVIGANQPWLPGVSFGHNDHVAWGATLFRADAQDLYIEKLNPRNPNQYESKGRWLDMVVDTDLIQVKGRTAPERVELRYTIHGPVLLVVPERQIAISLRWTGSEPGTAGYLAGIGLDRSRSAAEFRQNLVRWKMPGENIVYADVTGNIGYQASSLTPIRKTWPGLLPVPGWTGEYEWEGWYKLDDLPHKFNPAEGFIATANHNTLPPGETRVINYEWSDPARINRILEVLTSKDKFSVEDFEALQHDSTAWPAKQLVPLLAPVASDDKAVEQARRMLLDWDRNISADSGAAALYVVWEQQLRQRVFSGRVEGALDSAYASRAGSLLVATLLKPTREWFGQDPAGRRDALLLDALVAAVNELSAKLGADLASWRWGALHTATFRHALAADAESARLFNIGPFSRAGYGSTPFATGGRGFEQNTGSSYRQVIDLADWDRSVATTAPGQSGQPLSPHFDDLARLWAAHKYFPLLFSKEATAREAGATLVLAPLP